MNKALNGNMGSKRRQENMTPQKPNNNIIEDLVESEGNESPAELFCSHQKNDDKNVQ
jgi:hypothetical protein